jgi:hypothetical protein
MELTRDARLKRTNRVSGVKANSWSGIKGQDPVLKGRKENCRTKMDKGLLKGRGQCFPFLAKISINSRGQGLYKSGSWRRFTHPILQLKN